MAHPDSETTDDALVGGHEEPADRLRRLLGVREEQKNLAGLLFVLPNVAVFSVFLLGPVLYAFYLSFNEVSLTLETSWVGLEHYRTIVHPWPWQNDWAALRDPTVNTWWYALKNTVVYAIGTVPLQIYGGLAVALMLDKRVRAKKAFRAAYFMPVMLSGAASAVIWRWLLAADGVINNLLLQHVGLAHDWAGDPGTALGAIMLMAIWGGIGMNMILFLAGLQNIPEELYDAARIDGTSGWQRFRHVTWPNLDNTNFFVIVMAIIGAFQVFGIALVFEEGGPYYATTTTVLLIYRRAFEQTTTYGYGYGSAMAFLLFLIIFAFSYYQYQHRKSEEVEY